ncbi:MAG: site-2 protease family protein [Minisyncoccia bacterium]
MSILIFLGVLFVLVLVHELGHFMVAKFTGMRVDEFGIGFPPKLFGIKKGETLYSINALPIGGFVKIYGEDSVGVEGGDAGNRSFTSKSKWAQSAVLLAGVSMNILFAWLLVTIAFSIGVKSSVDEVDAGPNASLTITNVLKGSPAEEAKLGAGVVIKDVNAGGEKLSALTPSAFSAFVESHTATPITIAYVEKGELRVTQVSPKAGIIEEVPEKLAIGVALTQIDTVKRSIPESAVAAFHYTVTGLVDITVGIGSLLYDTILFKADFSQVAGPVGIVGLVGEASAFGITALLMFTAFISLNLAVINVLPFPALDGGRFLFVIIEALKGSPITPRFVGTINAIGFFILIALMIVVTWNDIARLL